MSKWPTVGLGEVANIERNSLMPEQIPNGVRYVGLEHVESGGKIVGAVPVEKGELASSKFQFTAGHVLYGKLRPYLAKIACPDFAGVCSTDIVPILPGPNIDRSYLAYFLRQPEMVAFAASRAVGINLPRISPSLIAEFRIPMPPLAEQRRIAAILDQADALRAKRRQALAELNTLTQSIFLEMFGDPATNPKRWPVRLVSDFVAEFQGGKSIEADSSEEAVTRNRVLKVSAATAMVYVPEESKPVPDSYTPPPEHFVRVGDLLFSRANTSELVGAVAYVDRTPPNMLLPDKLWRFVWRVPVIVEPLFVWTLFQTDSMRFEIGRRATGTSGSMKNISQGKLFAIQTICPPLQTQKEFTARLVRMRSIRETQHSAYKEADALFGAIQHRAFRGEL